MSRHLLEPDNPRHEVSIGWDPPMANFFLEVVDLDIDDEIGEPVLVWIGADKYASVTDVSCVLEEAAKWALVPDDLRVQLLVDQQIEGVRPPHWFLVRTNAL